MNPYTYKRLIAANTLPAFEQYQTENDQETVINRLYLFGGKIIDVERKTIYPGNLLIEDGIIAAIFPSDGRPPSDTRIIDISERFISPGFIDSHVHFESSMVPPLEFARAAVPHGTTCVLVDPHEITNVFGEKAPGLFMDQADLVPMDMYTRHPVPPGSAPGDRILLIRFITCDHFYVPINIPAHATAQKRIVTLLSRSANRLLGRGNIQGNSHVL
jgi:hypothetical protein